MKKNQDFSLSLVIGFVSAIITVIDFCQPN
jgi:hypothetical protein